MCARKGDNFTGGRRYHHLTSLQHRNFDCIIPAAAIGTPPLWPAGGRQTSSASVAVPAACPTLLGQATAARRLLKLSFHLLWPLEWGLKLRQVTRFELSLKIPPILTPLP